MEDKKQKTVVITGATSGIGLETARKLAQEGFRVIGIGRSENKCRKAKESICQSAPDAVVDFYTADLCNRREVIGVADKIKDKLKTDGGNKLHTLILNAGCAQNRYATTEDGIERQFALNYLSGFLLIQKLLPQLTNAHGRVIITGSRSHKGIKIHWDDLMLTRGYHPLVAYKQSKLCCLLLAKGFNDRYGGTGLRAYVADPGLVKTDIGTKAGGLTRFVWKFRKPFGVLPEIPANTYVWLCRQDPFPDGFCYHNCKRITYSREVTTENADRLFRLSERLCGMEKSGRI